MTDVIAQGLWFVAMVGAFTYFYFERRGWTKERSDLLDRIMAKDYAEYSQVVINKKKAEGPIEVVKVEDLEKRFEQKQENGIAI